MYVPNIQNEEQDSDALSVEAEYENPLINFSDSDSDSNPGLSYSVSKIVKELALEEDVVVGSPESFEEILLEGLKTIQLMCHVACSTLHVTYVPCRMCHIALWCNLTKGMSIFGLC